MRVLLKAASVMVLATAINGCALLGGGGKAPTTLVTLTPEAQEPAQMARAGVAGQSVTIATPTDDPSLTGFRT